MKLVLVLPGVLALSAISVAEAAVLEDFESLDRWRVIASDGVEASISAADGVQGQCLRLDFDFKSGAGFCVVRRELSLDLPPNYQFRFQLRGAAPANNLEFKLVDTDGGNVWWVNRREREFSPVWEQVTYKRRHFAFAWGPSGGTPLERLGAIEFAVAAGSGGRGTIYFDQLEFEPLPQAGETTPVRIEASSWADPPAEARPSLGPGGEIRWAAANSDAQPWIRLILGEHSGYGGLAIEWEPGAAAADYAVQTSDNGTDWKSVAAVSGGNGGRDFVPVPALEAAQVQIVTHGLERAGHLGIQSIRLMPPDFGESPNRMFATIAAERPRGWLPRYFVGEQQPWTVVGVAGDDKEALFDAAGAVEVDRLGFRLEPLLFVGGRLFTWADVATQTTLAEDYLPIPTVTWTGAPIELNVTGLADGDAGASSLLVRYRLRNTTDAEQRGTLFVAIRPYQVLPPWHELNLTGGASRVDSMEWNGQAVVVNGRRVVLPWTRPDGFGAAPFASGEIVEFAAEGRLPGAVRVTDALGSASGAFRFDYSLTPGESLDVVVESPFYERADQPAEPAKFGAAGEPTARFEAAHQRAREFWEPVLNRVQLKLPPSAAALANTFRTTQAYILVNADGPRIQPGSRTYERSWIRDGALTSTALLYTGHAEQARAFLEWFTPHQFESGKVPCVVDRRGPDPVPEHDSTGELIYALHRYYAFTGDKDFLAQFLPNVEAGVRYIESLRAERMTPEYRDGPPEKRVCYGLVPESISHEGYSAKPMHSYWDDFFVLRGLKDAVSIAQILDRPELAQRWAALRDEFRSCLYDSMRLCMRTHGIDYVPGCAELGDFDATSTAIGVFPAGELGLAPEPALHNTFERYYEFFCRRRDGKLEWEAYTPYEVRLIGTFVRLGQPQRAHELAEFFFGDQRPAGWNQWGEVVWRDPAAPRFVGDMPHTWVGSDYLSAARSMFVYEREQDESLVLAAAVRPQWLRESEGVRIIGFPTEFGPVSCTMRAGAERVVVELDGPRSIPVGGVWISSPMPAPVRAATIDGMPAADWSEAGVRVRASRARVEMAY
ncbi:MAG: discoidin domain-containing protein [Phycisphaerae bacterium]|jgi:hypothetical protein